MRTWKGIGSVLIGLALAACGGPPKQANDESLQSTPNPDSEAAPKWDSSSSTASGGSSSSSSGSSDSSSSGSSSGSSGSSSGSSGSSDTTAATTNMAGPHNEAEITMKRAARQVKGNCGGAKDADGKATGPFGKTMVTVVLGHNGHSQSATVDSSLADKPAGKCIMQAFSNLTYAPWAGSDVTVQWEVELVQPK